jgi:DNA-binding transcriptional MerR regulator
MYLIRAFAELTGVTVKALRHYERRGLLAPRRTDTGYRRYTRRDLERLERIIALKSLGLSLTQIKTLLDPGAVPLPEVFTAQRQALQEKRQRLDRAISAIDAIEQDNKPAAALGRFIGESAWARWDAKRKSLASKRFRAPDRVSPSRLALFHEIEASLGDNLGGDAAGALVARWEALIDGETAGDPETKALVKKAWANRGTWPAGMRAYVASCYGVEYDAWERVASFIESRGGP